MTPQETNRRINEHFGWRYVDGKPHWIHGRPPLTGNHNPLDFCGSLGCMHTAEATLTDEQHRLYRIFLFELTEVPGAFDHHAWDRAYISAPADKRAEAFLKVVSVDGEEGK